MIARPASADRAIVVRNEEWMSRKIFMIAWTSFGVIVFCLLVVYVMSVLTALLGIG